MIKLGFGQEAFKRAAEANTIDGNPYEEVPELMAYLGKENVWKMQHKISTVVAQGILSGLDPIAAIEAGLGIVLSFVNQAGIEQDRMDERE